MALLYREVEVINSTIGWEVFTLLTTFYSTNVNNNNQSAGNSDVKTLKRGSSETIRGSSFENFRTCFERFYSKPFEHDDNWIFWFIGFIEGDGAILEHKGRSRLVITQKDPLVLLDIQKKLGFGKVKKFDKFSRFIVEDNNNCLLLYILLNGNLVLEHRINQLSKWYFSLMKAPKLKLDNYYLNEIPSIITSTANPSLENSWISGFTDAEGCFSIAIYKRKSERSNVNIVTARFILDQQNGERVLNIISKLFSPVTVKLRAGGACPVKKRSSEPRIPSFCSGRAPVFRLSISCTDIKNPNSMLIRYYFSKFNLKTSKHKSFLLWCEILDLILGKQPLAEEKITVIRKLAKLINKFTIENNPTGSSKYS